ncbi:MAG: D-3-phosphoglycerate dehydrogenase [Candidatus Krumholzibacteriia bacterium]|jgi:D-3-phosphoglycerate dehydrogenase
MARPRVLISDAMSSEASAVFESRGVEVVQSAKMSAEELANIIGEFDGLAVRSSTKVTPELLSKAKRLKVVGRAGIGVDNINVASCTERGIVVMNTPFGNAITTAEHTLAMIFALSRHIPQANASTHEGLWEKSKYMGSEISGKLLGIIGAGNIGSIVAQKAIGIGMRVQAYDPFLSEERADVLGIKKVELEELFATSDIVSLHVPKTPETTNIIDATALNKMKKGSLLINCARGGLVDEKALRVALESGHLKGAALDVFESEPAKENILFGLPNVICTPHLGASTREAQEKVAVQVAEQMSEYLLEGAITNALNAPNLTAEEARQLAPYLKLADNLGAFAGQLMPDPITSIIVSFSGDVTRLNTEPLVTKAVQAIIGPSLCNVNAVNAQQVARDMGVDITASHNEVDDEFHNRVTLIVKTDNGKATVSGTVFKKVGRLVDIRGVKLESEFGEHMLYLTNDDRPGVVGLVGAFTEKHNINIANMHLGRNEGDGEAIALLEVDQPVAPELLAELRASDRIREVESMRFTV